MKTAFVSSQSLCGKAVSVFPGDDGLPKKTRPCKDWRILVGSWIDIFGGILMGSKLNTGDAFPAMQLKMIDGSEIAVPGDSGASYQVILFYRGSF